MNSRTFNLNIQYRVKFTGNRAERANFGHVVKGLTGQPGDVQTDLCMALTVALRNNLLTSNNGLLQIEVVEIEKEDIDA